MTSPPSSSHVAESFPDLVIPDRDFADATAVADWLGDHRNPLTDRANTSGALLLRGFPLATATDFHACVEALDLDRGHARFSYRDSLSNAVRIDRTDRVFTANEAPPEATIRLHHELAQTPVYPRHLLFFCERAAEMGGATALCRSDDLYDILAKRFTDFVRSVEQHGVVYRHVMPSEDDPTSSMGRSWRSTLSVESRDEATARLAALGYSSRWLDGDDVEVLTPPLPGTLALADGRTSFFNQIVATRSWRDCRNDPEQAARLGNGDPIPLDLRNVIAEQTDALAIDLDWQVGDLAMLDNHRVQHGRRPFQGKRSVLVAFGARA